MQPMRVQNLLWKRMKIKAVEKRMAGALSKLREEFEYFKK